jgi:hypothetical protein
MQTEGDVVPWKRTKGGYTTKRGGFVRRPKLYEKLRRHGMPKKKAARIANKRSGTTNRQARKRSTRRRRG